MVLTLSRVSIEVEQALFSVTDVSFAVPNPHFRSISSFQVSVCTALEDLLGGLLTDRDRKAFFQPKGRRMTWLKESITTSCLQERKWRTLGLFFPFLNNSTFVFSFIVLTKHYILLFIVKVTMTIQIYVSEIWKKRLKSRIRFLPVLTWPETQASRYSQCSISSISFKFNFYVCPLL